MKFSIKSILAGAFLLGFAACKKDKGDNPPPATTPLLSIKLDNPYLAVANVDSAFAIWKTNGQEQRIKLEIRNDSLLKEMSAFHEGNGQLTIHIFSNKKYYNQYFGQWITKKNISLQKNKGTSYKGPDSFFDQAWLPRVELKDAIGHEAVVALRPDDPYFIVKEPGWHEMYQYSVDRGYWKTVGGIALAGRDVWRCQTGCANIPNEDFFTTLPARIGNKPWNHISIAVLFEINDGGEGWVVSLEHDL